MIREKPPTPIQQKIYEACKLFVEVRLLAAKQGAAFTGEQKVALSKFYKQLSTAFADDKGLRSLEGLALYLEGEHEFKEGLLPTKQEVSKEIRHLMRHVIAGEPKILSLLDKEEIEPMPDQTKIMATRFARKKATSDLRRAAELLTAVLTSTLLLDFSNAEERTKLNKIKQLIDEMIEAFSSEQ